MTKSNEDQILIERFVGSFEKLDEMTVFEGSDPVAEALWTGDVGEYGQILWRPAKVASDRSLLEPIYSQILARFPPLFEFLVLHYRWAEVDLKLFRLMANPPGPDLSGLMIRDKHLRDFLLPRGFIQFGKGPDGDYDPVCFDISSRTKGGDYRVVKIDHEEILCFDRFKIVAELAPSFKKLVKATIERAES